MTDPNTIIEIERFQKPGAAAMLSSAAEREDAAEVVSDKVSNGMGRTGCALTDGGAIFWGIVILVLLVRRVIEKIWKGRGN